MRSGMSNSCSRTSIRFTLHDTPSRHLFSSSTRAFSHGCVRVEGPFKLAEQILLAKQGFTEKSLRAMVGNGERTIRLTEKIPVHLTYFTVGVDAKRRACPPSGHLRARCTRAQGARTLIAICLIQVKTAVHSVRSRHFSAMISAHGEP